MDNDIHIYIYITIKTKHQNRKNNNIINRRKRRTQKQEQGLETTYFRAFREIVPTFISLWFVTWVVDEHSQSFIRCGWLEKLKLKTMDASHFQ